MRRYYHIDAGSDGLSQNSVYFLFYLKQQEVKEKEVFFYQLFF